MKERIDQLITEAGAAPGTLEYLTKYQPACSKVIEELTEEEKNHCQSLADTWSKQGPDAVTKAQ